MHSVHTAGNYLTQVFSVFLATCGVFLLAFSTWQFGISEPGCCYSTVPNGNSQVVGGIIGEQYNWSSNCSELHKEVLMGNADLHMAPSVTMALALLGLVVRDILAPPTHTHTHPPNIMPPTPSCSSMQWVMVT